MHTKNLSCQSHTTAALDFHSSLHHNAAGDAARASGTHPVDLALAIRASGTHPVDLALASPLTRSLALRLIIPGSFRGWQQCLPRTWGLGYHHMWPSQRLPAPRPHQTLLLVLPPVLQPLLLLHESLLCCPHCHSVCLLLLLRKLPLRWQKQRWHQVRH
jgi:hypothetical protein